MGAVGNFYLPPEGLGQGHVPYRAFFLRVWRPSHEVGHGARRADKPVARRGMQ